MPLPISLPLLASQASAVWRHCREQTLRLVFPPVCTACDEPFDEPPVGVWLCATCQREITQGYELACPRCAAPLATLGASCMECHQEEHRFASAVALGRYDGLLRDLTLRCKGGFQEALSFALGQLLAESIARQITPLPDALVPMPAPASRRLFRRVNFPDLVAEAVSKQLQVPMLTDVLRFRRRVRRQTDLTAPQRRKNMRNALVASDTFDLRGRRLLIIDDVLTTGATADEATRALLAAGVAEVSIAVVVRGMGA